MLYKYRDINSFGLRLISSGELYFAKPCQLNDPLDCSFSPDGVRRMVEKLADEYMHETIREVLKREVDDKITGEKMSCCMP